MVDVRVIVRAERGGERAGEDEAQGGDRFAFAHDEMGGEIGRRPAFAQRRGRRSDARQEIAKGVAFGSVGGNGHAAARYGGPGDVVNAVALVGGRPRWALPSAR